MKFWNLIKSENYYFKIQIGSFNQKKKEKKKALSEGLSEWMQDFRLKNFLEHDHQPEQELPREKF